MKNRLKRVNVGCGSTPTPDWHNYDNSLTVRLAKYPLLIVILGKLGLLGEVQRSFASIVRNCNIIWADATKHIPLSDNVVEALYTSHMIEHLERDDVQRFLHEAHRVLAPNGKIRIAVPDVKKLMDQYMTEGDANLFIERTVLTCPRPKTVFAKLKYFVVGARHHLWMYDGASIVRLLSEMGFKDPRILGPGSTTIPNPGPLDLYERAEESVYVEAYK